MRNGWEVKKLGELCKIALGKTPPRKSPKYWDSNKNTNNTWVSIADLKHGAIVADSKEYISDIGAEMVPVVPKGTLMLTFKLTIGRVAFAGSELRTNEAIASLLNLKESIDKRFLYYFFSYYDWDKATEGDVKVKGRTLNKKKLKVIPIPLPPLPEQRRIVALLDEAFAAIEQARANLERNVANARELFQSKLDAVFRQRGEGWTEKTLYEISSEFGRGKSKHRPRNDPKLYGGEYPFIQTGDVRNSGMIIREFSDTYNERGLAQSKLWPKNTVCVTIAANIAESAILGFEGCFPDSVIGIIVDPEKSVPEFVYFALQYLKAEIQSKGKGSAQDNINLGTFKQLYFPFPDLKTQKELVESLISIEEECEELSKRYLTKVNVLDELKNSLLQRAFSGKLIAKEIAL